MGLFLWAIYWFSSDHTPTHWLGLLPRQVRANTHVVQSLKLKRGKIRLNIRQGHTSGTLIDLVQAKQLYFRCEVLFTTYSTVSHKINPKSQPKLKELSDMRVRLYVKNMKLTTQMHNDPAARDPSDPPNPPHNMTTSTTIPLSVFLGRSRTVPG